MPGIRVWRHVLVLTLLSPFAAQAQGVPRPAEFYFDQDAGVAAPIVAVPEQGDAAVAALMRLRERSRRDADRATAQLAHVAMAAGRTDTGQALYRELLGRPSLNGVSRPALAWNYGWDLYRSGEVEAALQQWSELVSGRLVKPAWAPPTLALALWRLDRKPEAVRWYAAAVRTEPALWRDPARLPALLPDWTEADRALLGEVLAAWSADPPPWP